MQHQLASHLAGIPRSGIRDFFEIVQSMHDVISLGIGEPDFATPWHIREAAIYGLEKGRTGYTSNLGLPKLRQAISAYVEKNYGSAYRPESEIIVTVGVSEGIDLALRALLNPGDEVLYHEPCYVSYSPSILLAHGIPVGVPARADEGFTLRAEDIAARLSPRSKVLVLNFPTNPTGASLSLSELEKIAALCVEHDLTVLSDEIYSELVYDDATHHSIVAQPGMRQRTLFLHGFSKAFAMTGFRIGYACGPQPLIDAMMKIHQYSILCAPIMGQEAALEALEHGESDVVRMRREYCLRRNYITAALNEMGLTCHLPTGAFYVFPSIVSTGLDSRTFSLSLLKEKNVAVVPGSAFGPSGEGFMRCSYATSLDKIRIAMKLMAEFVQELPSPLAEPA